MESIEVADELLYKYMPVLDKALIQHIENQVDTTWEFSQEFEKKMKSLIKKRHIHGSG